ILLLTIHHIVCDYWSIEIIQEELSELYDAYSAHRPAPLTDVPIQYADYAEWERRWLLGPEGRSHLDFWRRHLADAPPLVPRADRPRPRVPSVEGAEHDFEIPASIREELLALSQEEHVTLFMTTLAALQTLLHRYSGQDDIVIGTALANRNRPEVEHVVGF